MISLAYLFDESYGIVQGGIFGYGTGWSDDDNIVYKPNMLVYSKQCYELARTFFCQSNQELVQLIAINRSLFDLDLNHAYTTNSLNPKVIPYCLIKRTVSWLPIPRLNESFHLATTKVEFGTGQRGKQGGIILWKEKAKKDEEKTRKFLDDGDRALGGP
ncbi:hypothetical protein RND71_015644 [Anisodus tanguticus]|uniref:Uncharacterized protein n=1 Tax=Anisodus tanguticus TaxID=243964 RepID=A0AAE1VHW0_9SOLA|nr:hypothetical protein RND71_015644 [Anisodus tanguticus]